MTPSSVHDIRNLALVGGAGSGKTSLLEALLHASGTIDTLGTTERGDTVSDYDPLEKTLGHSLNTSLAHLEWAGHWVNLLDTPGTPDFLGRALTSLEAVETAVVCISATSGIEMLTRRLMEASQALCRMIVITRIDAPDVDLSALMTRINEVFGRVCLPINLPKPGGAGVVDCFFTPDYAAQTAFSSVQAAHDALVDQVVELDEELMAVYLEQAQSLNPDQLHAPFEQALREGHLIPVCFTSARTGAGIKELLDILGKLAPDPTEGNPPHFLKGDDNEPVTVACDADAHVVAHVFQIANDPYRGKLSIFRIHQGTIKPNSQLFIGEARKPFKVTHLLRLQGKNQSEIPFGVTGDICAVARIDEIHRDAVLHDSHDEDRYHLAQPNFPQAVTGVVLIPQKLGDEQKLAEALQMLREEDPCLVVEYDERIKHTVVRGLGEAHLKIVIEQLQSRWGLKLDTAQPAVPYRETISGFAEARYRHKKQSGGSGQFGEVALKIEPLERGSGFEFVDQVKGGTIPGQFMQAVEKGARQALEEGAFAGFPVHDIRVVVLDGKHHAVDSNEISFVTAARHAVLEAIAQAHPMILEPIVTVVIRAQDEHFGNLSGEFSSRRGRLLGTDAPVPGWSDITAQVPLAEMEGFEARVKSLLAGDSSFTVHFSHFEAAPPEMQQKLSKAYADRLHSVQ